MPAQSRDTTPVTVPFFHNELSSLCPILPVPSCWQPAAPHRVGHGVVAGAPCCPIAATQPAPDAAPQHPKLCPAAVSAESYSTLQPPPAMPHNTPTGTQGPPQPVLPPSTAPAAGQGRGGSGGNGRPWEGHLGGRARPPASPGSPTPCGGSRPPRGSRRRLPSGGERIRVSALLSRAGLTAAN